MSLEGAGKFVEAAAHLAEATDGKAPGISSRLKDRATLGHAKRLVRISKELRRFGVAEGLGEQTVRKLILSALKEAGASDDLATALSEKDDAPLATAEAEIERVIDLVVDKGTTLPAVTDGDVIALLGSGDGSQSDVLEKLVEGKVVEVVNDAVNQLAEGMGDYFAADMLLEELRGFKGQNSLKAYIAEEGRMESAEFRRSMSILVERGDVSGIARKQDGSFEVIGDVIVKQEDLNGLLERANIVHEFDMLDKE